MGTVIQYSGIHTFGQLLGISPMRTPKISYTQTLENCKVELYLEEGCKKTWVIKKLQW